MKSRILIAKSSVPKRLRASPRVLTALRRFAGRLPPTALGWATLALGTYSLWRWGYGSMDLVLFVVSLAGLALLGLVSLLVGGAAVALSRHLRQTERSTDGLPASLPAAAPAEPARDESPQARNETHGRLRYGTLETEAGFETGFTMPRFRTLPLVQLRWTWLAPAAARIDSRTVGKAQGERVTLERRCLVERIERQVSVGDVFGLTRIAWRHPAPMALRVLPARGRLEGLPSLPSVAAGDGLPDPRGDARGDRFETRRYAPGDEPRHILWKTYARTGELVVRLPERAVDPARRAIAYLLTGPSDEAAAAAARVALESGQLGERWLFGADGTLGPVTTLEAARDAIARSSADPGQESASDGATQEPAAALHAYLEQVRERLGGGSPSCIVFAPLSLAEEASKARREAVFDTLDAFGGGSLVFATDSPPAASRNPRRRSVPWRSLVLESSADPAPNLDAVERLLALCSARGFAARVVDRASGQFEDRFARRAAPQRSEASRRAVHSGMPDSGMPDSGMPDSGVPA